MLEQKITIVGMGPGSRDYLLPIGLKKIMDAEVLIGGKRHLEEFNEVEAIKIEITNNLMDIKDYILQYKCSYRIAVLVSGDPGFHSIFTYLAKHIDKSNFEIIPGISSLQLAFSRISMTWQDASLISLHGKELNILNAFLAVSKLGVLTDKKNTPQAIAEYYYEKDILDKDMYLCENLSYQNEKVTKYNVLQLAEEKREINNCVVVICDN
ncbi:MAG: precorrin-6y C5,15-methyltransferase (decarboxylating) subunit CbiE [Bacillota bacterium]|nr:precorrin-6y C5,15-methyltransferase (decarboxylating) subunit CbiE [Bacillota bacterium]